MIVFNDIALEEINFALNFQTLESNRPNFKVGGSTIFIEIKKSLFFNDFYTDINFRLSLVYGFLRMVLVWNNTNLYNVSQIGLLNFIFYQVSKSLMKSLIDG